MDNRKKRTIARGTRGSIHDPPTNAFPAGNLANPNGAPRKGMSRAEIIRTIDAMTPEEAIELVRRLGGTGKSGLEQSLKTFPKSVPFAMLEHLSARVSNVCEPTPSMLAYARDTSDGKPVERQELTGADGSPLIPAVINFVSRRKPQTDT